MGQPGPAVRRPDQLLQRGLAAQGAVPPRDVGGLEGTSHQVGQVPLPSRGLHQRGVAGFLQGQLGAALGGEGGVAGVHLVGPLNTARAGHSHGVLIDRTPLGHHQVVPAILFVKVGPFGHPQGGAPEDLPHRPHQPLLHRVVLLQEDAGEGVFSLAVVPLHVEEPFPPIGIVKKRGIKARGVQVDRLRPGALDAFRGHQVVVGVLEGLAVAPGLHIGVDQIKPLPVVAQAGGPDTARVGVAQQIKLRSAG
ncbi:hypothetical protein Mlute_01193 [Meiothermus luteus]|uniref:Uncharacterized protein n=1 Tax=Meiothermus luteus TaxID=2026184 RepID=A0A399ETB3_9DEIN|nr:hypothetical protein Mlute_01193 [Meiothermus luteus]